MIIGLYIGLAIFGIMSMIRGKVTLSKTKVVVGIPARLLGAVALTPFPLALVIAIGYVAVNAPNDPERFANDNQLTIRLIEAGCAIGVAVFVFAVAAMVAISPAEAERRERYDEEDDYDDRPRRSRNDDYDDEDDRPRRPRGRRDDRDDDEYDDRDRDRKPWNPAR